ncbi:KAP P-loop domain protein [Gemmatirosa kalamazoonensis]|uniref:KAP P-loop domain protein n=1 Tax=Gemmatirosa kalamazoonensis TaxID=861299 RepID=W0RG06_9BACT|nr:P-loop NTPase fold protein [Gemmatirosa kalamazoonensis]AHG89255.1 KAP P-loop domain protein [Gemmatirosa kalamazoonensis]
MATKPVDEREPLVQSSASSASSASSTDAPPHPELESVARSLTDTARLAFGVADAIRRVHGRDAVAMEHLVLGLRTPNATSGRSTFDRAGLDAERLTARLREAGFDAPAADRLPYFVRDGAAFVSRSDTLPPLTPEVVAAVTAAALLAGATADGARPTHLRHLLAGFFAVRSSPVVALFDDVRPVAAAVLHETIEQGARDDELSDDEARRQLAELEDLVGAVPVQQPAPEPPRIGTGGGAANDRAEGEDRLNFTHYVRAFADLIDSPDTRPPLTIGIFGAWGAGKSFLLRHLIDEVERRGAAHRPSPGVTASTRQRAHVYCIAFNAWEYNAAEHIWPRLVRRVLDGVTRDVRWHRRPVRWARTAWRKLRRNFLRKLRGDWKTLLAWIGVGAGLWWGFAHLKPEQAQTFARRVFGVDTSDDKFSVPAIVGAVTAAVMLLRSSVITPLGGWVTALLDDGPGYGGESDFVRAVRADLDLVDEQLRGEGSRVLITIDDLDRCEPDKAVEVLQAINQLLDRRSFVVCLGIDARVITAAVEQHYEELLGPAGITGYEYLDKIVQIPFRIPEPTSDELKRFLGKQLGDPPEQPGYEATSGTLPSADPPNASPPAVSPSAGSPSAGSPSAVSPSSVSPSSAPLDPLSFTHAELRAFEDVATCMRRNPRHVKRLVNVYALVRSLATLGGSRAILDDPAATVRWLTLCAQWPYAVYAMLDHLDAHGPPLGPALPEEPPLHWLYEAVRPALDPAKQARFDHDGASLERLVRASEGLSWSELQVLRGYTVNFNPALDAELRADVATRRRGRAPATSYDRRMTHLDGVSRA